MPEIGAKEGHINYKRVPWCNWEEWKFVRESIFSSSSENVSAALRRISTWRLRGCLPCAVEVTGALVEVQQNDPFFRRVLLVNSINSEQMLVMAYCMAIMRLVNGFTETSCKRNGLSIFESADVIGIPRTLVDIRHECSHRQLPSLALVRLASTKALDWLKMYYWDPQQKLIPDVRQEVLSGFQELASHLNSRPEQHARSLQVKQTCAKHIKLVSARKRCFAQMSEKNLCLKSGGSKRRIEKSLVRLSSLFPSEVLKVLVELIGKTFVVPEEIAAFECSDNHRTEEGTIHPICGISDVWKAIVVKIASRKPLFLLALVEAILKRMVSPEAITSENGDCSYSLQHRTVSCQQNQLSSIVLWLLQNLSGQYKSACLGPAEGSSLDRSKLERLLFDCLFLSPGHTHLLDSAVFLAEISGNNPLAEKLRKLPQHNLLDLEARMRNFITSDLENILREHENSLKETAEKLEVLRLHGSRGTIDTANDGELGEKLWKMVSSWSSCPIGMLQCSFGSSELLPVHENIKVPLHDLTCRVKHARANQSLNMHEREIDIEHSDDAGTVKKREGIDGDVLNDNPSDMSRPLFEGRLLINGIWMKPGQEDLLALEHSIKLLV